MLGVAREAWEGAGYQKLRQSSPVRPNDDGRAGEDAQSLHGLPEITAATFSNIAIERAKLAPFAQDRVHRLRSRELYEGPFVVVHQSPPATTGRIGVAVSGTDAVFNESFYGYSPVGYADPHGLVRYLALILGSRLAVWFALLTSGKFGFERDVIEKATLDRIPLPDFQRLTRKQHDEVETLYYALLAGRVSWDAVDEWVARLYGLGVRDLQIVSDTLAYNLPFAQNKRDAQEPPTSDEQARFAAVLEEELRPLCERFGSQIAVRPTVQPVISPWYGLDVRIDGDEATKPSAAEWQGLLRAADDAAASEILLRDSQTHLLAGRLAQRRYWSQTQARLLAQRIAWSHIDMLRGSGRA